MSITAALRLERYDRHVARSYVRNVDSASRYRAGYALEEALRLMHLPGEDEGRIYCFRRVALADIPGGANRQVWIDRVQQAFGVLAARAVHARDQRAALANGVYFHNTQEAFEILLRQALYTDARLRWFAASVLGITPEAGQGVQILALLECLRRPAMPPGVAAAIILETIGGATPISLLAAIPASSVREWLAELGSSTDIPMTAPVLRLPDHIASMLRGAAEHFGWRGAHVTWLATLAVIYLSPAAASSGGAVAQARSILRQLEPLQPAKSDHTATRTESRNTLTFDDPGDHQDPGGDVTAGPNLSAPLTPSRGIISPSQPAAEGARGIVPEDLTDKPLPPALASEAGAPRLPVTGRALLGEPTAAAGLYFLLHVLRHLGIASALESGPALAEHGFPTRILKQLALHAGVARSDPILDGLQLEQTIFSLSPKVLLALSTNTQIWPVNLVQPRRQDFTGDYLLRAWTLAVCRWCWRMGRLTVGEIVTRPGRVWLTRSDLDVTLPLAQAGLPIRRLGLDIDPGWLPWLGACGKVVRFHYRDDQTKEAAC